MSGDAEDMPWEFDTHAEVAAGRLSVNGARYIAHLERRRAEALGEIGPYELGLLADALRKRVIVARTLMVGAGPRRTWELENEAVFCERRAPEIEQIKKNLQDAAAKRALDGLNAAAERRMAAND